MKKEIWKKIDGFRKYEISNFGDVRVKNFAHTGKTKLIIPLLDEEGYEFVILESQVFYIDDLIKMYFQ